MSFDFDKLDSLELDLEGVSDTLDSLDLNSYDDVTSIDVPHIKVATKEFKELLKVAKSISSTNAKDIVSKSICIEAKEGKAVAYVTDFDVYLEMNLDLLNTENILEEPVCFPIDTMIKLMKAVPSSVILFKDEEGFKIKLAGGSIPIETHNLPVDKYKFQDELKVSEVANMNSTDLYNILRDFTSVVTSAISPNERRIVFDSEGAVAVYMFTVIQSHGCYPTMDIKLKDLGVLKNTLAGLDCNLTFFDTADETKSKRKVIQCDKFKYAFLTSDSKPSQTLIDLSKGIDKDTGLYIDFLQLYKLVELSSELNYSLGKIGLKFTDENKLCLEFKTKKGKDNLFLIDGTNDGEINTNTSIDLQSKFVKVLLSSFSKLSSIKVNITDKALVVSSDSYQSVLFTEN